MGLQIGFNVWDKKDGKLVEHKLPEKEYDHTWQCGRCGINYEWEYGCSSNYENKTYTQVVFNKEFDGYEEKQMTAGCPSEDEAYTRILRYIPFEEFKNHMMEKVNEVFEDTHKAKSQSLARIKESEKRIKEYQELQLRATTDFVFDKFQEKIEEERTSIEEDHEYFDNIENEDYDYTHAVGIKEMLTEIDKHLKQGLVVTTFFSD